MSGKLDEALPDDLTVANEVERRKNSGRAGRKVWEKWRSRCQARQLRGKVRKAGGTEGRRQSAKGEGKNDSQVPVPVPVHCAVPGPGPGFTAREPGRAEEAKAGLFEDEGTEGSITGQPDRQPRQCSSRGATGPDTSKTSRDSGLPIRSIHLEYSMQISI